MRNTAYMADLQRDIQKYDSSIRGLKEQCQVLYEEIREVDAAIGHDSKLKRYRCE